MAHEHGRSKAKTNTAGTLTASTGEIVELLRAKLADILQDHPVAMAYLYGSVSSGKTTPFSDIDIALVLNPDCDLDPYGQLKLELELEAELDRCCGITNADVRCIGTAPLRVQGKILVEGILLYCADDDFRVTYETQTRKSYFDFQPVLSMMRQARFARLEERLKQKGSMVDVDKIDAILSNLELYVDQLQQLAEFSLDGLANDMVRLGAAKYYLQVAVESCIDAANHIIASEGFRSPESYVDSFSVLAENGIVDQDFLPTLHRMARLRSRLVHLYWEVDVPVLHSILQDNLDDFDRYRGDIYRFVQQSQAGGRRAEH